MRYYGTVIFLFAILTCAWAEYYEITAEELKAQAEEYREMMIDAISIFDDELAEKFL